MIEHQTCSTLTCGGWASRLLLDRCQGFEEAQLCDLHLLTCCYQQLCMGLIVIPTDSLCVYVCWFTVASLDI